LATTTPIPTAFARFFAHESAGGIVLAVAALLALILSNSPWAGAYEALLNLPGELRVGRDWLVLAKPLIVWVNELWMAVFFLVVGLEIKRELGEGELASWRQAALPAVAALGGMALPALIYAAINLGDTVALRGWAIPAATDIAFAIGVLMLLGPRVPASLKVFVTAVAIIDDLGAIVVIALFYTEKLSLLALAGAALGMAMLLVLNRMRVMRIGPYVVVGLLIWLCVLKSGVHATLAGVATAMAIPLRDAHGASPLQSLEHALHPWVAFLVLPVFAFSNAGVSLAGVTASALLQPVTLGIVLGLVVGKAAGVFGTSWLLVRLKVAQRPEGASWTQLFGACVLCGIGFTMSLFIGALAFEDLAPSYAVQVKLGVLCGSMIAALLGALILVRAASSP
jgi:Na+:H+ antiporter, NhaA family